MKQFIQFTRCSRQNGVSSIRNRLWEILLPAYCILLTGIASAQIYPVQATPQLVPPYSFKLSDYQTTSSEKLFLNLLLTDAQESGRQVRLKMYVEGQGLNIQTLDFVTGATPIVLDGGVNLRLTNLDLRPYFNLNNLVGITPLQYGQPLPEGRYNFCFEVYDAFSGQRISNKTCAFAFLILNDPPILNIPGKGDLVTAQNPQNIIFNWTPRHINAPAVQYEFTLKELWDTGMDPQAAFLASPPLYQTTTFAPTLLYGPADIQLLEGKTYAWQVRAFVGNGAEETSLFRNNGYSEIYHFKYTANCSPPSYVLSEAENASTVNINWQNSAHIRYQLQYRKKGYGDDDWFEIWTQENQIRIRNLEEGTTYEFRVGGECTLQGGLAYSAMHEFTIPTEDEIPYYNCGIPPEVEINNQDPLQNLGVNEVFTAGDFPVVVREVSGSNGYFSGWGYITLPFLESIKEVIDVANVVTGGDVNIGKFTRIRVEFDNIKVNTDYQLVEGMVETSYDPNWSGIVDVDQAIEDIKMTLAQLVEMLSNIGIDSTTRENIKNLTDMLVQQAQAELPQPIAQNIQEATEKMQDAKEKYDAAIKNGNTELADQAENEFKDGQKTLKDAEKERKDFLDTYASIIKNALKEIVRESNNKMENGLDQYGEESIVVKETNQALELTSTNLDELSAVFVTEESSANEQELIGRFEYERWKMLNYIATNLQTDEGTQELGKLLENEGETLGVYIYNRLEEGVKKNALTTEVKELIIQIITEKIALSTKLF